MADIVEEYENFIRNIKKVVQLRDLQYEELMTTGKYSYMDYDTREVFTVPKDPETLYVAPSYSLKWLIQKIYETSVKPYEPQHEPIVLEELTEYVKEFLRIKNLNETYVAMRGICREGDSIKYSDDYYLFINDVLYDHDYVCIHHAEYITVVIVAKDVTLNLKYDDIHILPEELVVWRNHMGVYLENRLCSSATYVTSNVEEECLPDLKACKILKLTTNSTTNQNISPELEELYFYGRTINTNRFNGCNYLHKVYAPYVTSVGNGIFNNASSLDLELPRLVITTSTGDTVFSGLKSLKIPKSFSSTNSSYFFDNIPTVYLECINAKFNAQTITCNKSTSVKHVHLAKGWNASIPLHTLYNLDVDDMIENFNNLKDLTGEDQKSITLYTEFYRDLINTKVVFDESLERYRRVTDDESENPTIMNAAINAIEIATKKNWSVTGK